MCRWQVPLGTEIPGMKEKKRPGPELTPSLRSPAGRVAAGSLPGLSLGAAGGNPALVAPGRGTG